MSAPAVDARARMRAASLSGWPQRLLHTAVVLAGWGLFVWGWYEVLGRPWDSRALWWLIVGCLIVLPLVTIAWTLHNIGIHRRKGPRQGRPQIELSYAQDWNGREVVADWSALADARVVSIETNGNRKVYRIAGDGPAQGDAQRRSDDAPGAMTTDRSTG